jgi:hypothetical protein
VGAYSNRTEDPVAFTMSKCGKNGTSASHS